jgi:hypothetical protein
VLDRWRVPYAAQSERRNAARTFAVTDAGAVIGYYALLAGELDHGERLPTALATRCLLLDG